MEPFCCYYSRDCKVGILLQTEFLLVSIFLLFLSMRSALWLSRAPAILGIIVGVGATMVRESSAVMLGHYFKRRRQFVEMITMSGEGVGIALFSVILKEGVG